MQARELIELAAVVSAHGPVLIRGSGQLSTNSIDEYWTASKCRLDRWGRSLKSLSDETAGRSRQGRSGRGRSRWPFFRSVIEEILTGEVLTRVWTAVICAYDRHRGTELVEPVVRSVLIGHLEARHRVLTLLVHGPGIDAEQALKLNRLRRRTERWTDMLIGYLAGQYEVTEFAVDPARAKDFAEDLSHQSRLAGGRHVWPLVLGSLRAAFRQGLSPISPNADLNTRIATSIVSCFQPELFDSTGVFRSLWLLRLTNITADTQVMLDELLSLEDHPATEAEDVALRRLTARSRRFDV